MFLSSLFDWISAPWLLWLNLTRGLVSRALPMQYLTAIGSNSRGFAKQFPKFLQHFLYKNIALCRLSEDAWCFIFISPFFCLFPTVCSRKDNTKTLLKKALFSFRNILVKSMSLRVRSWNLLLLLHEADLKDNFFCLYENDVAQRALN